MFRTYSALFLFVVLVGAAAPAGEKGKPFKQTAEETKVFELTNQERKKKDVPALKFNPALSKIARAHSENMARQEKMEHILDGKDFNDRIRDGGYKYSAIAENIGSGKAATLEMIMKAWMDSEGHRVNILNTDYTEIGVGAARDKEGRIYLTQVFGRPRK